MSEKIDPTLHERTLAKPLIRNRVELQPGDRVELRQDQIDRLEPEGYFEPIGPGGRKAK